MATYKTELFGHVVYSPELTYEDLLAREEEVKEHIRAVLTEHGGDFLHFEALGDTLRVQCVFQAGDEDFFQALCAAVAPWFNEGISARLLFIDKDLESLFFYGIRDGAWQEAVLALPECGFLDAAAPAVTVGEVWANPVK